MGESSLAVIAKPLTLIAGVMMFSVRQSSVLFVSEYRTLMYATQLF